MTDRKARVQEDECMQSTESSGASLSLDNLEPGILRTASNTESSKPSTSAKGGLDMSVLDSFLIGDNDAPADPYLEIVEQPKQKDLRFRYECEGRSAGSLLGVKTTSDRKTYPTVKIKNYTGKAKIVACLVTRQTPHQLHPNGLVGKLCKNGICSISTDINQRMTASFPNLGIQCAKKKDIQNAVQGRQELGVDPFNQAAARAHSQQPDYEMNVVRLCFQAFLPDPHNPTQFTIALQPQVSVPIYDKKGASLNISRVDRNHGTVSGGDEMFILCDKVQKDDIEVVFFDDEKWEINANFGPSDIHRQVAIVCKTPPYKTKNIQQPVTVQFKLRRKSDRETSDPMDFIFKPIDLDADGVIAKRRKKSPHFSKFFIEDPLVKQEPGEASMLQHRQQQQQQFQQIGSSNVATASTDPDVRQKLRSKIEQNSKQPNVKVFNPDPSLDARQPTREFARAVRRAPSDNNPRIAKFSPDSSTFSYSDRSNMSFGTVIQRDSTAAGAAATTTGTPFAMPQPQVPMANCSTALLFQDLPMEPNSQMATYQLPVQPSPAMADMASTSNFGENAAAQVFPPDSTGTEETESFLTNDDETLLQYVQGDFLQEENLAALLAGQDIHIENLVPPVNLEELTTLEDFDPRTLSLRNDMSDGMDTDFAVENVNDSVSIPYSHSVELEHDPSLS
ncbi:putative transcription factor p65 homolog [Patiria miniata]|uniref:RHD domain-containing protein n=1 Tax=Patiria miniata TaxID=46514 RepID=A0A914BFP9_PATMI|nr:putative transcription factor p65 homolog [Patiria miniata]